MHLGGIESGGHRAETFCIFAKRKKKICWGSPFLCVFVVLITSLLQAVAVAGPTCASCWERTRSGTRLVAALAACRDPR